MRKILVLIALVFAVLIVTACGKLSTPDAKPRENRAMLFATWAEPKASCVPLTTAHDLKEPDTALCEIKGYNHWCIAPAASAPTCSPYGAPPEAKAAQPAAQPEPAKGN